MRIPTWRLALTGGAIVVLAALGVGLVAASSNPAAAPAAPAAAAPSAAPGGPANGIGSGPAALRQRLAARLGGILPGRPLARHLVHATITVTDRDGNLVTMQLDHGTIGSIGSDSLVIDEAGGGTITVATDDATVVRLGGGDGVGTLGDLKAGDEVLVQSRVDGGTALAKHILRVPASTAG